jgi:hypothetical protein
MSPRGGSDLLVLARRVLLDALDALDDQREALILIGAQAIYIHTGSMAIALPETTKDSDIAIDRRQLADDPLLEQAMTRAGFRLADQPGSWFSATGVPVDLMMPESMSDPGGKRGARAAPHAPNAIRRATGLEAAIVDHSWQTISALEAADQRVFAMRVAGPAALLISKMHKLGERRDTDIERLVDKDAHDVYRLLSAVPTDSLAAALHSLRENHLATNATEVGLRYFSELFAAGPDAIGCVMAGRAEELVGDPAFVSQATATLAEDLLSAVGGSATIPVVSSEPLTTVPAESRFVVSLADDLRRHDAAGAAGAVMRGRAADFVPRHITVGGDTEDLLRLANHGLVQWGIAGLHEIEEDGLIALVQGWLPLKQAADAEPVAQVIGAWRKDLDSRELPSPARLPVTRESVVQTLTHLQLGLRGLARLSGAENWTVKSRQDAAEAADQFGRALARAFRGGIINALPRETLAALTALRSG